MSAHVNVKTKILKYTRQNPNAERPNKKTNKPINGRITKRQARAHMRRLEVDRRNEEWYASFDREHKKLRIDKQNELEDSRTVQQSRLPTALRNGNEQLQIVLRMFTGDSLILNVNPKATSLGVLKNIICRKTNIPPVQQSLSFNGRLLSKDFPLARYGIKDGHTVHCMLRLRGGSALDKVNIDVDNVDPGEVDKFFAICSSIFDDYDATSLSAGDELGLLSSLLDFRQEMDALWSRNMNCKVQSAETPAEREDQEETPEDKTKQSKTAAIDTGTRDTSLQKRLQLPQLGQSALESREKLLSSWDDVDRDMCDEKLFSKALQLMNLVPLLGLHSRLTAARDRKHYEICTIPLATLRGDANAQTILVVTGTNSSGKSYLQDILSQHERVSSSPQHSGVLYRKAPIVPSEYNPALNKRVFYFTKHDSDNLEGEDQLIRSTQRFEHFIFARCEPHACMTNCSILAQVITPDSAEPEKDSSEATNSSGRRTANIKQVGAFGRITLTTSSIRLHAVVRHIISNTDGGKTFLVSALNLLSRAFASVFERNLTLVFVNNEGTGNLKTFFMVHNDSKFKDTPLLEVKRDTSFNPPAVYNELQCEGSGMRSAAAILLHLAFVLTSQSTNAKIVFLLDEPEVFLHPEQCRRLACAIVEMLAHPQVKKIHLIVSTHSSDFINKICRSDIDIARTDIDPQPRPGLDSKKEDDIDGQKKKSAAPQATASSAAEAKAKNAAAEENKEKQNACAARADAGAVVSDHHLQIRFLRLQAHGDGERVPVVTISHCGLEEFMGKVESLRNPAINLFTKVIDGMFFERVVVVEGPSDAYVYELLWQMHEDLFKAIAIDGSTDFSPAPLFVPIHGKSIFKAVRNFYTASKVTFTVALDLDALKNILTDSHDLCLTGEAQREFQEWKFRALEILKNEFPDIESKEPASDAFKKFYLGLRKTDKELLLQISTIDPTITLVEAGDLEGVMSQLFSVHTGEKKDVTKSQTNLTTVCDVIGHFRESGMLSSEPKKLKEDLEKVNMTLFQSLKQNLTSVRRQRRPADLEIFQSCTLHEFKSLESAGLLWFRPDPKTNPKDQGKEAKEDGAQANDGEAEGQTDTKTEAGAAAERPRNDRNGELEPDGVATKPDLDTDGDGCANEDEAIGAAPVGQPDGKVEASNSGSAAHSKAAAAIASTTDGIPNDLNDEPVAAPSRIAAAPRSELPSVSK